MNRQLIRITALVLLWSMAFMSVSRAQAVRVEVGKRITAIPKICESVVPASLEGNFDISILIREAVCKGSGDMLSDYTYVMTSARRTIDKKGIVKEQSTTFEVYMPTLKGGTRGKGILLVTKRNGIPIPAAELEKEREKAGERLEQQDDKIERQNVKITEANVSQVKGLMPVGMYPRARFNRSTFGITRADVALTVQTYLEKCTLTFERNEQIDGRTTLVFNFVPRADSKFNDNEEYIAKLHGKIWIDAEDRIVMRLAAWPSPGTGPVSANSTTPITELPPAIYIEMSRLPEGVWLSKIVRLNGANYRKLFEGVNFEVTVSYSDYKRFTTETRDVQLDAPNGTR